MVEFENIQGCVQRLKCISRASQSRQPQTATTMAAFVAALGVPTRRRWNVQRCARRGRCSGGGGEMETRAQNGATEDVDTRAMEAARAAARVAIGKAVQSYVPRIVGEEGCEICGGSGKLECEKCEHVGFLVVVDGVWRTCEKCRGMGDTKCECAVVVMPEPVEEDEEPDLDAQFEAMMEEEGVAE